MSRIAGSGASPTRKKFFECTPVQVPDANARSLTPVNRNETKTTAIIDLPKLTSVPHAGKRDN
jgi:hypothetical protein